MGVLWEKWPEWELVSKIGHGSYGSVYKAKLKTSDVDTFAAIKVVSVPSNEAELYSIESEGYSAEQTHEYFKRIATAYIHENEVMQQLRGEPNVVSVDDCYIEEKENGTGYDIFIRMELLTPLSHWLKNNTIDEKTVAKLGIDICTALEACEKHSIVHRDIKPDNILRDSEGVFKLGDFGIARNLERLAGSLTRIGSENYVAPEVVFGRKYDNRADIYSLGIVLFSLMNGRRLPFWPEGKDIIGATERHTAFSRRMAGDKLPALKNCSDKMQKIIFKACEFNEEDRYHSAAQMKADLQKLIASPTVKKTGSSLFKENNIIKVLSASLAGIMLLCGIAFGGHKLVDKINENKIDKDLKTIIKDTPYESIHSNSIQPNNPDMSNNSDQPTKPDEQIVSTHTHSWDDGEITIAATCKDEGILTYSCSCGEIKTEDIPKLTEHSYDKGIISENIKTYTCTVCGETKSETMEPSVPIEPDEPIVPTHTHSWDDGEITIAATCKEEGIKTYTCSCGETKTEPIAKLAEHSYNNGTISGSVKTYTCTLCGDMYNETVETEPDTPKPPTEPNEPIEPDIPMPPVEPDEPYTPPHEHSFDNETITREATCKDAGELTYSCSCGVTKTEDIPKITEHSYDEGVVEDTTKTYTCIVCGDIKTETVQAPQTDGSMYTYYISNGEATITKVDTAISGDVVIPDTFGGYPVTTIAKDAFRHCDNMRSITIPDNVFAIQDYAFYSCDNLTTIYMGNGVTTIGDRAFFYCYNLTEVYITDMAAWCGIGFQNSYANPLCHAGNLYLNNTLVTDLVIPENIASVGRYAFNDCSSLNSVIIPHSVKSIGKSAFLNCSNLTRVVIPASVISIDRSAFEDCGNLTIYAEASSQPEGWISGWNFSQCPVVWGYGADAEPETPTQPDTSMYTYSVSNGGAVIKSVDTTISGDVIIPSTLGGYPVTTIAQDAFKFCDNITSVTIPDSVTVISYQAFYGCDNLASINMGNGVQLIGEYAFSYCDSLTSVVIGESVSSIWEKAFAYCKNLTSVIIPISVTSIRSQAFEACPKLTIYAEAPSKPDGWSSIWNILGYPVVWGYTDEDNSLDKYYTYTVADGKATITDVDTKIAGDITIPSTLGGYPVECIGSYAFNKCSNITSVSIPEGVVSIEQSAFEGCRGLKSVSIPDTVTIIGNYVFLECDNLTDIVIPGSVSSIGNMVFKDCKSLREINVDGANTAYKAENGVLFTADGTVLICYPECKSESGYDIPYGVENISTYAFHNCTNLESITLPDTVTSIEPAAFCGFTDLKGIIIPGSVTYIGPYAVEYCSNLTIYAEALSKPEGWDELWNDDNCPVVWGYGADAEPETPAQPDTSMYIYKILGDNVAITGTSPVMAGDVVIPSHIEGHPVTSIGEKAFLNRTEITYVTIPDTVTLINQYAFTNCKELKGVTVGEGVSFISSNAFRECESLESINIPQKVKSIGSQAFYGCNSLKEVHITDLDAWIKIQFSNGTGDSNPLYYGAGLYINGEAVTSIDIGNNITEISGPTFIGCSTLTDVVIGDSVNTIGFCTFNSCPNLRNITIGKGVMNIEQSSFSECPNLTSITVSSENISYMSVNDVLFTKDGKTLVAYPSGKTDDTYVIPSGTETIGYWAFSCCTSLKKLVIPQSVETIESNSFWRCDEFTIYCEVSQKPDSWHKKWNNGNYPVVWGYKTA